MTKLRPNAAVFSRAMILLSENRTFITQGEGEVIVPVARSNMLIRLNHVGAVETAHRTAAFSSGLYWRLALDADDAAEATAQEIAHAIIEDLIRDNMRV